MITLLIMSLTVVMLSGSLVFADDEYDESVYEIPYMNFSIDDAISVFEDINNSDYESIFDNDLLNFLKELHDSYGTKCVLYCFYENNNGTFCLSGMTDRYMSYKETKISER